MRALRSGLAALAFLLGLMVPAAAQNLTLPCYSVAPNICQPISTSFGLPVNIVSGSVSASFAGFAPNGNYASLSVTNSSSNVALPAGGGTTIVVYNTGSVAAFVKLGTSSGVTVTTTTGDVIQAGSAAQYTIGSNTFIAGITASGSTTLAISGGSGVATGWGGATAATIASGADVTEGAIGASAGCTSGASNTMIQCMYQMHTDLTSALPSGTNGIGTVNPTTPANWGIVATGAAPPANAIYLGANASGATGGHVAALIQCDSHLFKHITSATDTFAVQGIVGQTIYICGWRSRAAGVATWFLENTASTNANCSSANTQINGLATEAANTGENLLPPFWTGLKNTSGNGLCINSTGTGGVDVDIWYTQF